jgi:hypothetical protein
MYQSNQLAGKADFRWGSGVAAKGHQSEMIHSADLLTTVGKGSLVCYTLDTKQVSCHLIFISSQKYAIIGLIMQLILEFGVGGGACTLWENHKPCLGRKLNVNQIRGQHTLSVNGETKYFRL